MAAGDATGVAAQPVSSPWRQRGLRVVNIPVVTAKPKAPIEAWMRFIIGEGAPHFGAGAYLRMSR